MRQILLLGFLLLTAISTYSQSDGPSQPCTLKLSQAPAVHGVKLGMTVDELFALFPGSGDKAGLKETLSAADGYSNFGYASFQLTPSLYSTKDNFAGIETYSIQSFDRRVVGFNVSYVAFPTGARWRNPDDLVQRFTESLHLPSPKNWTAELGSPHRTLNCDGFQTMVSAANEHALISFTNRGWERTQKERFAAFEEQKRRDFKP